MAEVGEEDFGLKVGAMIFGRHCSLIIGEFSGHGFQGYTNSAPVIAETGEIVGKVGVGGNNDTVHLSISGAGCTWVHDWQRVANGLATMAAKITRCDLAFDDYLGQYISPRDLDARVERGDLIVRAAGPGKPPKTRFVKDHGHGTGCSFYAGKKGRKELCVYEKGKEQGDRRLLAIGIHHHVPRFARVAVDTPQLLRVQAHDLIARTLRRHVAPGAVLGRVLVRVFFFVRLAVTVFVFLAGAVSTLHMPCPARVLVFDT